MNLTQVYHSIVSTHPQEEIYHLPDVRLQKYICPEMVSWKSWCCYSAYCHHHWKRWAKKVRAKANKPPKQATTQTYAITLPIGRYIPAPCLTKARQYFRRYMLEKSCEFEFFWRLHYEHHIYNFHLITKSSGTITSTDVEYAWRLSMFYAGQRLNLRSTFYCEPIVNFNDYANYVSYGHGDDHLGKLPPRGLYRALYGATKGYAKL